MTVFLDEYKEALNKLKPKINQRPATTSSRDMASTAKKPFNPDVDEAAVTNGRVSRPGMIARKPPGIGTKKRDGSNGSSVSSTKKEDDGAPKKMR